MEEEREMILEKLQGVSTSKYGFNDHIILGGRVVAIRADYDRDRNTGLLNLRFSDSKAEGQWNRDYCIKGLSVKEAQRIVELFLYGHRVKVEDEQFDMEINQGKRWCWIEKRTPKRLRISYEMPNAGIMGGWWKNVQINQFSYIDN